MARKATKKKVKISESKFQKWVLDAFEHDRNVILFRRNVGAYKTEDGRFIRFSEKGQSDLWGIIKSFRCSQCNRLQEGVHAEIELKTGNNKLTIDQQEWLCTVADWNGIAICVYPAETDPIGLRDRIYKLITSSPCPQCYEKSLLTR